MGEGEEEKENKVREDNKKTDGVVMNAGKKKKKRYEGVNEHRMKDVTLLYSTHSLAQSTAESGVVCGNFKRARSASTAAFAVI